MSSGPGPLPPRVVESAPPVLARLDAFNSESYEHPSPFRNRCHWTDFQRDPVKLEQTPGQRPFDGRSEPSADARERHIFPPPPEQPNRRTEEGIEEHH